MQTLSNILSVVGQDIDLGIVRSLTPGDLIFIEHNGLRNANCPLVGVASTVESVDDIGLIIRNSRGRVELRWDSLLEGPASEPAVFVRHIKNQTEYVILQFVAYSVDEFSQIDMQPDWSMEGMREIISDPLLRKATIRKMQDYICRLREYGMGWNSMCRVAIRAGVSLSDIKAYRENDEVALEKQSVNTILKILRELSWLKAYKEQNRVQVSAAEFAGESNKY